MEIDGEMTANKQLWKEDAFKFGQQRFGSSSNSTEKQASRMELLHAQGIAEKLNGRLPERIPFFDILDAKASLPNNKGVGPDGIPSEIFSELPLIATWHVWQKFEDRYQDLRYAGPISWKILEYVGIPKTKLVKHWSRLRWISKIAAMEKWYVRTIKPTYTQMLRGCDVNSYGFRKGSSPDLVVGLIRQLQTVAAGFGHRLAMSIQDVATAFDDMDHEEIFRSLRSQGASFWAASNLIRELSGFKARLVIPTAGATSLFDFESGGKQGGIETPDEWNALLENTLASLARQWRQMGWGAKLDDAGNLRVAQVTWADNIFIFSNCISQLQTMVQELTNALYAIGLRWKRESLELMVTDLQPIGGRNLHVVTPDCEILHYEEKDQTIILGTKLDRYGTTIVSMDFRLLQAEKAFWATSRNLCKPGSIRDKLDAWEAVIGSVAIFGCRTWHVTAQSMHRLRVWELKFLRKVFHMRRKPMPHLPEGREPAQMFNQRTARKIYGWFAESKRQMLFQKVIVSIHKAGWDECKVVLRNGTNPLAMARSSTSRIWWAGVQNEPLARRRSEGLVFSRTGPQSFWEDPLVAVWGLDWRMRRDRGARSEWMTLKGEFLSTLSRKWRLPLLEREHAATFPAAKPESKATPSELPMLQVHPEDKVWSTSQMRFRMVVDCQTLGRIINGHTPLQDDGYRPVFRRMADALDSIFKSGWRPSSDWKDTVVWRERIWNSQADFFANRAMDRKAGHFEVDMAVVRRAHEGNLMVYSDGGLRRTGMLASAAWIAYLVKGDAAIKIGSQSRFLQAVKSSFQAEVIALDMAYDFVRMLATMQYDRISCLT